MVASSRSWRQPLAAVAAWEKQGGTEREEGEGEGEEEEEANLVLAFA